jgi:arabinofuranosyltransferase
MRRRPAIFLVVLLPLALGVWKFNFVCDDAFISYRYSQNLAAGDGLRYNVGVEPPVEGYSNLLWVIWIAVAEVLSWNAGIFARITTVLCAVLLLWNLLAHAERRWPDQFGAMWVAGLLFAVLPPVLVWSTGGLATLPFALAWFLAYRWLLEDPGQPRPWRAGASLVILMLLRSDGIALSVWLLLCGGLVASGGRPQLWRALLKAGLLVSLAFGAHLCFRFSYHGDWVPNTAHVKVAFSLLSLERGAYYLMTLVLAIPSLALVPLLALRGKAGFLSLLLLSGVLGYGLLVGGDFMAMGRFLVPAMPHLALALAAAYLHLQQRNRALAGVAVAACLVISVPASFGKSMFPESWIQRFHFRWNWEEARSEFDVWGKMKSNAERWSMVGRALRQRAPAGASVVAGAIGAIGYYSGLKVYDQNGLVTREVALREVPPRRRSPGHAKSVEPTFFLDQQPTYMGAEIFPRAEQQQPAATLFQGRYRRTIIPLAAEEGFPPGIDLYLIERLGIASP